LLIEGVNLRELQLECQKCKTIIAQKNQVMFCPKCGTRLTARSLPKYWVFQFNPSIYRWSDRIATANEPEQWLVSHHFSRISINDLVAIWRSGDKSGIYAIGEVISSPEIKSLNPAQEQFFTNKYAIMKFSNTPSVNVRYLKVRLDKPILQKDCEADKILLEMQILLNPQGTNFRLTPAQGERIEELLDR
jgi:hypothetical protein